MVEINMDPNAATLFAFITYMGSLTAVSIVGLYVGWYHVLWVWVLPLLTGFDTPWDDE